MFHINLENKVAIVTGAGKGIGRNIALTLAEAGAKVVIMSRTESDLMSLSSEIEKLGSEALVIPIDIRKIEEIYRAVEKSLGYFSKIDILVNNAGVMMLDKAVDFTEDDWNKMVDTNLKGTFFMSQAVAKKAMIPQKSGKIVNISSQLAFVGNYERSIYCSTKGGILQMTRALAIEWSDFNIHVNSVAPGYTKTEMTKSLLEDENKFKQIVNMIPLRKVAETQDVSVAVLYLVSEYSNFVTGQTIIIDGGYTAR